MSEHDDDPIGDERASAHERGDGPLYDAARRAQYAMVEFTELLRRRELRDPVDAIALQEMTSTMIGMIAAALDELADQLAAHHARRELDRPAGRRFQAHAPNDAVAALRTAARRCAGLAEDTATTPTAPSDR